MSQAIFTLQNPTVWSNTAQYKPNSVNYPSVTLPQVIYGGDVYTYKAVSTVGATPDTDSAATVTFTIAV